MSGENSVGSRTWSGKPIVSKYITAKTERYLITFVWLLELQVDMRCIHSYKLVRYSCRITTHARTRRTNCTRSWHDQSAVCTVPPPLFWHTWFSSVWLECLRLGCAHKGWVSGGSEHEHCAAKRQHSWSAVSCCTVQSRAAREWNRRKLVTIVYTSSGDQDTYTG